MKLRTLALASTALVMPLAAYADDNEAFLDQLGFGNSALIEQTGDDNTVARERDPATQDGFGNDLDILQGGDRNTVGAQFRQPHDGLDQTGSDNVARINQLSDGNIINIIQQETTGEEGTNRLRITQTSDPALTVPSASFSGLSFGNTVTRVEQTNTGGDDNTVRISQDVTSSVRGSYSRNEVGAVRRFEIFEGTILNSTGGGVIQDGAGNAVVILQEGARNRVTEVNQSGDGNFARTRQDGINNNVSLVFQENTGGVGNSARVVQIGENNGRGFFRFPSYGLALDVFTTVNQGEVTQIGSGNLVNYRANGDSNLFGFYQSGTDNTVGNVLVRGAGNQTAAYQNGDGNMLNISPVVGDDNDIGAYQDGDMNIADISLTGGSDRNSIGVLQLGTNYAQVNVDGSDNFAGIAQLGAGNEAFLDIDGNLNGWGLLSGDAGSAGLFSGIVIQTGERNLFDSDITGNRNEFASTQLGNDNEVLATVDGNRNEYAVLQVGNGNLAVLSQIGNGNNAGIIQ